MIDRQQIHAGFLGGKTPSLFNIGGIVARDVSITCSSREKASESVLG